MSSDSSQSGEPFARARRAFPVAAPHALKAALKAAMVPVYDWLVTEIYYPFDMQFGGKPPWLDPCELAEAWQRHDPSENTRTWLFAILEETGWDE